MCNLTEITSSFSDPPLKAPLTPMVTMLSDVPWQEVVPLT